MTKACFKCGETKPLSEFYRHPQMGDGHLNKCKECTKIDVRRHRRLNDSVREYDRARAKLPHRQENRRRIVDRWAEQNPLAKKAQTAVNNAVRDGRLAKEPCAFCRSVDALEAHHHDYSKPLDVTWLCKRCHRRFHAMHEMFEGAQG